MSLFHLTRRFTSSEPNLYHFVMDIAWFGLALATTTRFLSVFAIHVGATATHLAWLTALPALMLLLSSTLSGWWRARYPDSKHAVLLPSLGFRFNFFFLALTPFLPLEWQPIWIVVSLTLTAIPQGISGVIFLGLMRESVENERWTLITSRRHMAMNATIAIGAIVAGLWLEKAPFPMNYQIMFLLAFVATMFSLWHVMHVKPIYDVPNQSTPPIYRHLFQSPRLKHILWMVMLTHIPFFMVYPLVPLQLVEGFHAEESFIAIFGLTELIAGILIAGFANQWMTRWGQQKIMTLAMMITGVAVALIALSPNIWLTLPAGFMLGGSWTLVGIGIMGLINDGIPQEQALSHNMFFMQCVGLSTFIGPMLGNLMISSGFNLITILMIGAGLRVIAGGLISFQHSPEQTQATNKEKLVSVQSKGA